MKQFDFTIGWIFASICSDGELRSLIGRADMLNHAIPTLREITDSLVVLYANGLIDIDDGKIILSSHGEAVFDEGKARRGGQFSIPDNMRKSLNKSDHPIIDAEPNLTFLSESSYEAACKAYLAMFERAVDNNRRGK